MLRVFGCVVQYRPHTARAGRFSQREQWGLHLGIEKNYNAWKIFDVHLKETVVARDVIFYERLTLQTYLDNLAANRDLTGGFRGNRAFASAADEADWDEQNVDGASEEAGPLPYCSVNIFMDDDNPRETVAFDVWLDDLQLFLQCDSRDGLSLFDLTSGASTAPAADADSTVRSQWLMRDAAARLAVRSHLPPTERAHFSQYKSAKTLYDAVVARYSSPATAALNRLMLPYLFPDLAAFATVTDLIMHLRTSDTHYRAALPA
ncbi:unnamed protein product, partial [Closterium sp. NIES-53]